MRITVIACEPSSAMFRGWIEQGHPGAEELATIRVGYVDLPTDHWPQLTRPEELAHAILAIVAQPDRPCGQADGS